MAITLLKACLIGGITSGVIATSIVTPLLVREGLKEVLLIAKSKSDSVKLFFQEQVEEGKNKPKVYLWKAQYKGVTINEDLLLCSPSKNKDQYFLLKLTEKTPFQVWRTMEGIEKGCENALDVEEGFGEAISIKFLNEPQDKTWFPPKEIYLSGCQLQNLNQVSAKDENINKLSLALVCSKDKWQRPTTEVKIADQGLFYI